MTTIVQAAIEDELNDLRRLMRGFAFWRREQHAAGIGSDNGGARRGELEHELADGLGRYAPPHGRRLIAYEADTPVGCAALCELGCGICEVEGIFVTGLFRGQHVGRALMERLILEARAAGYQRMRLSTYLNENEAMHLCESAGFHQISPDGDMADAMQGLCISYERDLSLPT